jgi:hypothetical protein
MAGSSGGGSGVDGEGNFTQSVITAAPGTAQFDGVWLIGEAWGQQAASPNVGLTLDGRGLTVSGPAKGQSNTLPWTWVQHFAAGTPMTFPDGRTATVVEVGLIGRSITLLVPPDQLRTEEIKELNRYVPKQVAVAEPAPAFVGLGAEEAVHFTEVPEHTEVVQNPDPKPEPQTKTAKERAKIDTRSSRLAILLACLVAVAIAGTVVVALRIRSDNASSTGVVIPVAPPTTAPPAPSTMNGPPASANPLTVAEKVNLTRSELPAGWSRVVLSGKSFAPSTFADVHSTSNQVLASCLRLPRSHVGIMTGSTEPGGPKVFPSGIYVMKSGLHPSAISVASLVGSAAIERSDLSALLQPGTARCLDAYYASSFSSEHETSALVNRFTVPQHAGEQVIGLDVHIGITQNGHPSVFDWDVVVIGAGRLEIDLGAQQDNEPFPSSALDGAVQSIEARAAVAAGGH